MHLTDPLSSELGTLKTVTAGFWPWLEPCSRQKSLIFSSCSLLARLRFPWELVSCVLLRARGNESQRGTRVRGPPSLSVGFSSFVRVWGFGCITYDVQMMHSLLAGSSVSGRPTVGESCGWPARSRSLTCGHFLQKDHRQFPLALHPALLRVPV